MLHAKLFFYHPTLPCHSILLGKNYSTLIHSFGRGLTLHIYVFTYKYFFQETLLSSFIALSKNAFGRGWMLHAKLLFYHPALPRHSILLGKTTLLFFTPFGGGWLYIYTYISFKNLFYHPALLYQSMLLEGVHAAFQTVLLSSCFALSFHTTRAKNYSTLIHSFGRGLFLYIYIYTYRYFFQEILLSSFIALSKNAFGRGWMLHAKLFFYHPTLPCHSILLGKNYSILIHSFGRGLILYIPAFLLSRIYSIILHCSINPCFWEGGGCCMPNFSFIILYCTVSPYF